MQAVGYAAETAERISKLIEEKLGVGGRSLHVQVRRARRELPGDIRAAGERIATAADLSRNPKLAKRVDPSLVERDASSITRYLSAIDPVERRKTRALRGIAVQVLNLLLIAAAVIAVLVWRGFL